MQRMLLAWMLLLLVSGCASAVTIKLHRWQDLPAAGLAGFPPLPLTPAAKSAAVARTTLTGAMAAAMSAGAEINGTRMVLAPAAAGLEWSYYELPTNDTPVLGVEASLDLPDGSVYVALSNYQTGCWDFVHSAEAEIALAAGAANVSPGGFVYLAVAAYDAATVRVFSVSILLDQPGWLAHQVVSGASLGYVKLFADGPGGLPHIAYIDLGARQVRLARASQELPQQPADWETVPVDAAFSDQFGVALDAQFISGRPAVAYCNNTADQLLYAYAQLAEPQVLDDWTACVVDESFTALLPQISLCESALMPRLAYDSLPGELRLAASDTATPESSDWELTSIADDAHRPSLLDIGLGLSLSYLKLEVDGLALYYARSDSSSPQGPADWDFTQVAPSPIENFPGATALVKVRPAADWLPCIASLVSSGYELRTFQALDPHPGESDWTEMILEPEPRVTALAAGTFAGRPAVVFTDTDNDVAMAALASVPQPQQLADWQLSTVAANGGSVYLDVCEVADTVAVAYYDSASQELRFAYLSP